MKPPKFLTQALEKTLVGWLAFSFVIPLLALWSGVSALIEGNINIRGVDVTGLAAKLYAISWIFFGLASLGIPRDEGSCSSFNAYRLIFGMALFILFLLAGTISLILGFD